MNQNKKLNNQKGFTIIEMLMVIMLVAILAAVAIPQFLDFRSDAKQAATAAALGAMRSGLANQKGNLIMRCNASADVWPDLASIQANDISDQCEAANGGTMPVMTAGDRRIMGTATLPINAWAAGTETNQRAVVACTAGGCTDMSLECVGGTARTQNDAAAPGWCYNPVSGEIWANTSNNPDTAKAEYNL